MMGDKNVELVNVTIDVIKEAILNMNGNDEVDTRPSNNDNQPGNITHDQPINDNHTDQQNWNIFKQIKSLCFAGNPTKQQRIQSILVSINSTEADLNHLPKYPSFYKLRCNRVMVENILLGIVILTVVAAFLIPVILYYTGPPIPEIDDSVIDLFKTCKLPDTYTVRCYK